MSDSDFIRKAIHEQLERELYAEVENIIIEAKSRVKKRISEIVAGMAIRLMEEVSIDRLDHELRILIKMENKEKKEG